MFQSKQEKGLFTFYREQAQQEEFIKKYKKINKKQKAENHQTAIVSIINKHDLHHNEKKKIYPLKKADIQKSVLQQISQHEEHKIYKSARQKTQIHENYKQQQKKLKFMKLENQTQNKMQKAFFENKNLENLKSRKLKKFSLKEEKNIRSMQLSRKQSAQSLPKSQRINSRYTQSDSTQFQPQLPTINSSGTSMGRYLIPKVKIKSSLIQKALKQNDTNNIRRMRQELRQQIQKEKQYILHHLRLQKFHQNPYKKLQNQQSQNDVFIGKHRKLLSILRFKIHPK